MIVRVTVANTTVAEMTEFLREAGLSATLYQAWGFTPEWGAERGTTAEIVTDDDKSTAAAEAFVIAVLTQKSEQAAYVTYDGNRAILLYRNGTREVLSAS